MSTVLFVHGTGVRRAAYDQTFALIGDAIRKHEIDLRLGRCAWGDTLGATGPQHAVPGARVDLAHANAIAEDARRWAILADDPFFELRVLAARSDTVRPRPPGTHGDSSRKAAERVLSYSLGGPPHATVVGWGLNDLWLPAWEAFRSGADLLCSAFCASEPDIGEPGLAAARAATACLLLLAVRGGRALPSREHRDGFVIDLADNMGVLVAGRLGFLKEFFVKAALGIATRYGAARREAWTDAAGPVAGDVLLYQARGAAIRAFVKQRIADADGAVVLLAHSLGGIACVDLLVEDSSLEKVRALITVGSQAPFFYEIGALVSLSPGTPELPAHFPRWLNLYDEYDFLSYLAQPVFGGAITDVRINSGQPFPLSHGAYWSNPESWCAIKGFLTA